MDRENRWGVVGQRTRVNPATLRQPASPIGQSAGRGSSGGSEGGNLSTMRTVRTDTVISLHRCSIRL